MDMKEEREDLTTQDMAEPSVPPAMTSTHAPLDTPSHKPSPSGVLCRKKKRHSERK